MTSDVRLDAFPTRMVSDLRKDQLQGIAAWEKSAELTERVESARHENRQASTEARRRLEALRRTHQALLARSEVVAAASRRVIGRAPARAVVVHRLDWMRDRLAAGLTDQGIVVVGREHDGADGLGLSIAEQPDLLVVEDRLPSVRAIELISSLREFAPKTLVAAQVEHSGEFAEMLAAGASAVFSRRVPPADVCLELADFLRQRPDKPLILA